MADRCGYWWERRPAGARYVTARGQCKRNATAECHRCSEHCNLGPQCSHELRRRRPHYPYGSLPGEYMGTPYGDGY